MREFTLLRMPQLPDATLGVFIDGDQVNQAFALTLERSWKNNQHGVSCIPGNMEFICKRFHSEKHPDTWVITDIPGDRTDCLFHIGNIEDDTHGCVCPGEQFGNLNGKDAVLSSGIAMQDFMKRTEGLDEFKLKIVDPFTDYGKWEQKGEETT